MYNIPVFINNINRLTTTKKLVEDLKLRGYREIYILDNNSTYPPLLEWYKTNPCNVWMLGANFGQLAIYNCGAINKFENHEWVAYTDSDIELNPATPNNFISTLIKGAEKWGTTKAGLALKIDDLPDNDYANKFKEWEGKYWVNVLEEGVYKADVDTTFCVIKPSLPFSYTSIRIADILTAKHIPWYSDLDNLSEEEQYYIDHSEDFSTYKRYYNSRRVHPKPSIT